jgi:2-polyprenyl-6-methoxyphenol hydroxylase-like FAD-dependent oxidoreductase
VRVLIVGAGIGGLSAAIALQHRGLSEGESTGLQPKTRRRARKAESRGAGRVLCWEPSEAGMSQPRS